MTASPNWNSLSELLARVGPLLQPQEITAFAEEKLWMIAFDDQRVVEINWNEPNSSLVFTSNVGRPESSHLLETYEKVLLYNSIWQKTGGARLALEEAGGDLLLIEEFPVSADLNVQELSGILEYIHQRANSWSLVIRHGGSHSLGSEGLVQALDSTEQFRI